MKTKSKRKIIKNYIRNTMNRKKNGNTQNLVYTNNRIFIFGIQKGMRRKQYRMYEDTLRQLPKINYDFYSILNNPYI